MIKSFKDIGWEESGFILSDKCDNRIPPRPIVAIYKFIWDRFGEYTIPNNLPEGCHIEFYKM